MIRKSNILILIILFFISCNVDAKEKKPQFVGTLYDLYETPIRYIIIVDGYYGNFSLL